MRLPPVRFTVPRMMIAAALLAVVAVGSNWMIVRPVLRHMAAQRWYRRVEADYQRLAQKRPPGVTPGQWEFLVGWTENLHGNYGPYYPLFEPRQAERFAEELERRLDRPVSTGTIDWIWDRYMAVPTFRSYDRYRPTRSPDLATAQPGYFGRPVP